MKTNFDGVVNTYSDYRYGLKKGTEEYNIMSKLDEIEVETYVSKYYDTAINTLVFIGLLVIILSPFIIDYFTR
jgi:hypothetical protein